MLEEYLKLLDEYWEAQWLIGYYSMPIHARFKHDQVSKAQPKQIVEVEIT